MKIILSLVLIASSLFAGVYVVGTQLVAEVRETRQSIDRLEKEVRRAADVLNGMGGQLPPP